MRINYYKFPENTPEDVLLANGCAVVLKTGSKIYPNSIPEEKRQLVDYIDDVIGGLSVKSVKSLIKKYGGSGWTEHSERDGGVFEVTEIKLQGNNSRFRYNHHL